MVVSVVVFSRNFYCCCCCFCSPLLLSHWLNSEIYDRLVHFCIDRDTHTGYTMVNLNIMCFIISYCSYNFRILLTGRAVWIFPFCEYAKKKNRRRRQEKKKQQQNNTIERPSTMWRAAAARKNTKNTLKSLRSIDSLEHMPGFIVVGGAFFVLFLPFFRLFMDSSVRESAHTFFGIHFS